MARQKFILALLILSSVPGAATPLVAEDEPPPPAARLSVIEGEASVLRGDDTSGWVSAAVNAPLVPGDSIFAGPDSRAEIQLDHNNVLRLAERTQVRIANLTEDQIQIEISQGLMDFAVLRDAGLGEGASLQPSVEVDTPNVAMRPILPGVYRIQVDSDSQVEITVRKGRAEVFTSEGSATVERDKTITVQGTDSPEYQIAQADSLDDWDTWNTGRDRTILEAQSWRYANRYYTGANDLDQYGDWVEVRGYSWCWTPRVGLGWVPYANGRWVWEPFWGWTWVSSERWGWAPYHYGRWFRYEDRWVWWPGQSGPQSRPVYAPAYVAFLGFGFGGHNFAAGYGYGYQQVGWVPVGPSDGYYPWWGQQNTYQAAGLAGATGVMHVRRAYQVSTRSSPAVLPPLAAAQQPVQSNLQNALGNPGVRESIVTVSTDRFTKGQIAAHPQTISLSTLSQSQWLRGTLPIVPTRESLKPADRPVSRTLPAVPIAAQHFFAKTPAPSSPRPFSESAAEIRQMIAEPHPPGGSRSTAPPNPSRSPVKRPGWRVSGAASQSAGDRQAEVTATPSKTGARSSPADAPRQSGSEAQHAPAFGSAAHGGGSVITGNSDQAAHPLTPGPGAESTAGPGAESTAGIARREPPSAPSPPQPARAPASSWGRKRFPEPPESEGSGGGTTPRSSARGRFAAPAGEQTEGRPSRSQAGDQSGEKEGAPAERAESTPKPPATGSVAPGENQGSAGRQEQPRHVQPGASRSGESEPSQPGPPGSREAGAPHPDRTAPQVAPPAQSRVEREAPARGDSSSKDAARDSGSKKN